MTNNKFKYNFNSLYVNENDEHTDVYHMGFTISAALGSLILGIVIFIYIIMGHYNDLLMNITIMFKIVYFNCIEVFKEYYYGYKLN